MSLKLIYGRSGSGKSQFIFDEVKGKMNNDNKIYIITPEQFSYQTEKRLLEVMENDSVINAEAISFKRIADRVFTEIGGACTTHLSKAGQAMLIYSVLNEQRDKLKFLGSSDSNVEVVLNTITELKKHNVDEKRLADVRSQY